MKRTVVCEIEIEYDDEVVTRNDVIVHVQQHIDDCVRIPKELGVTNLGNLEVVEDDAANSDADIVPFVDGVITFDKTTGHMRHTDDSGNVRYEWKNDDLEYDDVKKHYFPNIPPATRQVFRDMLQGCPICGSDDVHEESLYRLSDRTVFAAVCRDCEHREYATEDDHAKYAKPESEDGVTGEVDDGQD